MMESLCLHLFRRYYTDGRKDLAASMCKHFQCDSVDVFDGNVAIRTDGLSIELDMNMIERFLKEIE
jgi:hypothetical protein